MLCILPVAAGIRCVGRSARAVYPHKRQIYNPRDKSPSAKHKLENSAQCARGAAHSVEYSARWESYDYRPISYP